MCAACGDDDLQGPDEGRSETVEVTEVAFADSALSAAVHDVLGQQSRPVTASLASLQTQLSVRGRGIARLDGLDAFTSLEALDLADNAIVDLSPLTALRRLRLLDLDNNQVVDLTPLAGLDSLQSLVIANNRVADLSPLAGLARLEAVDVSGNPLAPEAQAQLAQLTARGVAVSNVAADVELPEPEQVTPLAGLPGRIAFVSDRAGNFDVYAIRADGTEEFAVTSHPDDERDPAWSPDGKTIAFTRGRGSRWDIWLLDLEAHTETQLTDSWDNRTPAWSPDGSHIVFTRATDVTFSQVYAMDADGANLRRLTDYPGNDLSPAWSPDGSRIAFSGKRPGAERDGIYLMSADGSGLHRLGGGAEWDTKPAWSPDGRSLAVVRIASPRAGTYSGYPVDVIDLATGDRRPLTADDAWVRKVAWSPDGTWLAFSGVSTGFQDDIFVLDLKTGAQHALVFSSREETEPAWTPTQ